MICALNLKVPLATRERYADDVRDALAQILDSLHVGKNVLSASGCACEILRSVNTSSHRSS